MSEWSRASGFFLWIVLALLTSCAAPEATVISRASAPTMTPIIGRTITPTVTALAVVEAQPFTPTPHPTQTASQSPSPTATITATWTPPPTPTPVACSQRMADDDQFLTQVTRDYGLSRDYEPGDLVPLSDYFPHSVTLGYPTEVRAAIIEPLQRIVRAMQDEDLAPQIISGYRSYSAQSLARQKWLEQYPDWAHNLSAPPGHSEHQLGTTVDFGSPELKIMLGEAYVQFHPAFAQTSEGKWLAQHAHEYGFTMSYPADAFERTTFYFEPWHFRYVGREVALDLAAKNLTISEYLSQQQPIPCLTD